MQGYWPLSDQGIFITPLTKWVLKQLPLYYIFNNISVFFLRLTPKTFDLVSYLLHKLVTVRNRSLGNSFGSYVFNYLCHASMHWQSRNTLHNSVDNLSASFSLAINFEVQINKNYVQHAKQRFINKRKYFPIFVDHNYKL